MPTLQLSAYVAEFAASPLARWTALEPWELTSRSAFIVEQLLATLPASEYIINEGVAVHRSAIVEPGAVLKDPLILGPGCLVASGAYLRGGSWAAEGCTFGPGAELKSSFVFPGTKLAHFNFVGDSILGSGVNLEAGSIICNYRNERASKAIRVRVDGASLATGCSKFGAVVGDHSRMGANAVLAPGTVLSPSTVVRRLELIDHESSAGARGG